MSAFLFGLFTCLACTVHARHHKHFQDTHRKKQARAIHHDKLSLGEKQASMTWTRHPSSEGPTYSVIVVEKNPHASNLFRDKQRVKAYTRGVVSVQFASPYPTAVLDADAGESPFHTRHHKGASERVTIVHATDLAQQNEILDANQVSHLTAVCQDPSQRIILVMTDETCARLHPPSGVPAACWANVVRQYPYNAPSPDVETRNAYIPLGPRDTFRFVSPSKLERASQRNFLFNLEVRLKTSQRRSELVGIVDAYKEANAGVICHTQVDSPLDYSDWQVLLLRSKFTITPGGHNPETFRMFEALEAGSIPIVSKQDYLDPPYEGPHACGVGSAAWNTVATSPFARAVSVDTWQDLPNLLDRLREEPQHSIDKLQADCTEWYEALMQRTYGSLLNFGQGLEMWPQAGPIGEDFLDPT